MTVATTLGILEKYNKTQQKPQPGLGWTYRHKCMSTVAQLSTSRKKQRNMKAFKLVRCSIIFCWLPCDWNYSKFGLHLHHDFKQIISPILIETYLKQLHLHETKVQKEKATTAYFMGLHLHIAFIKLLIKHFNTHKT